MKDQERATLTVRSAKPAEAEKLSALALRSKAYWDYDSEFLERCREELSYTAGQIQAGLFHFALGEARGECVGFYALFQTSPEEMELQALFVEPAYIGKGYGRALMEHARHTATMWGASRLIIQGDPNAERFYRAAGGVLSGWRESESIPGRYLPLFTITLPGTDV